MVINNHSTYATYNINLTLMTISFSKPPPTWCSGTSVESPLSFSVIKLIKQLFCTHLQCYKCIRLVLHPININYQLIISTMFHYLILKLLKLFGLL